MSVEWNPNGRPPEPDTTFSLETTHYLHKNEMLTKDHSCFKTTFCYFLGCCFIMLPLYKAPFLYKKNDMLSFSIRINLYFQQMYRL